MDAVKRNYRIDPNRIAEVAIAVANAIEHEQPLVVLPTRAWWTWLPMQGVARALSQVLTPS